ncbi:pirin [Xanthomonas arboricola]|uniref:pirin family protein n=1 Tax=Xanthomonas arboricola TaxID=56448 RepID=UPI00061A4472|nr:pirin family protein [Xanthomonas arboricola]AKC80625.1 pirin [Xanthomonas arboricola]
MSMVIAQLHRANNGGHFRGYSLRGEPALLSPFIGVDHYWMSAPTFAPHRHAGMSAVSYLLLDSETGMANRDSIGTDNLIRPGGLHWTTAGYGVVHEEVPAEPGKTVHGLQIFVGLAPSKRDIPPFPLMLEPQDVPVVQRPGARIRVPVGRFDGTLSPLTPPTEVSVLDVWLDAGAELSVPVAAGHSLFAMPIFGTVEVADQRFGSEDLRVPVFPAQDAPREIFLSASQDSVKVVLFSGPPLPLI